MLNIITSLSPVDLATDMIGKIKDCWKNPFVSPVIVFTDLKTEQWFNLHILGEQKVSMNLQTARLESFLFSMLKTAPNQSLLAPDLLRDIIIQKLLSKENETRYMDKIKDNDNIENYLYVDGDINYKHLFDFANTLATLFIEYEATRENIDDAVAGKDWQKDLYNDIINDGIEFNNRRYYTCPQLAEKNKYENNGTLVFKEIETPVFVFGFSGMGQTYRKLLKEFGEKSDVYVFLQTTKNNDGNENIFLKHWAQFGNTNHRLFDANEHSTHILATYKENTTLGKIQNAIANDENIENLDELKVKTDEDGKKIHDDSLTITSAPSKIKELEIVHSSICDLLKDPDKNATLKDILVLAPDIDEYKSAIMTVFGQTDESDTEYPFIPISIVDYSGANSSVLDLLQTLYAILHNGGLTRKTFFAFTKNPVIQNRYNITDEEVNIFQQWIENMNVYRIHKSTDATSNAIDDWEKAVNRLLTAKLTDKPIFVGSDEIEPFSDFDTEDNELLTKFVQIFYDIKNDLVKEFKDKTILSLEDINQLQAFLNKIFTLDECNDTKLFKDAIVWDKVNQKIEQYKDLNVPVPMECFILSLIDIASNVRFNTGTVFTRGVTFTSLMANRILPAKYIFLIGMNSDNFPGVNKQESLDRRIFAPQNGDDSNIDKNKNAFLCQLMATSDELHISFVDKDLQKDNKFYPSYVLDILTKYTQIETKEIGIDETRKWDELYTPRERRNKQIYIKLNNPNPEDGKDNNKTTETEDVHERDLPDTVRVKEFQYYLENPLKCYANRAFGFEEEDNSHRELEDIEINKLIEEKLKKRLVKPLLENKEEPQSKNYKDLLPNKPFDKIEFDKVKEELKKYIGLFKKYNKEHNIDVNIESNYPINIPLECDGKKYVLRGEVLMCAHTDTDIYLYAPIKDKNKARKYYPEMYALVAQNEFEKCIAHIMSIKKNTQEAEEAEKFPITKECAKEKLNEFYRRAFKEEYKKHIPYFSSGIFNKKTDKVISFEEFKIRFMDTKYNYYFISHQELMNPDTDLGFMKDNFEQDFKTEYKRHEELIIKDKKS